MHIIFKYTLRRGINVEWNVWNSCVKRLKWNLLLQVVKGHKKYNIKCDALVLVYYLFHSKKKRLTLIK